MYSQENIIAFINIKPKNLKWLIIIMGITLLISLIIISKIEIYDNYQTIGKVENGYLMIEVPQAIQIEKIIINMQDQPFEIISKTKIDQSTNKYTISLSTINKDQEIINLNIYYNKERIIDRIRKEVWNGKA